MGIFPINEDQKYSLKGMGDREPMIEMRLLGINGKVLSTISPQKPYLSI